MAEKREGPQDFIDWKRLEKDSVFIAGIISDILEKNFSDYRHQKIVAMAKAEPLPPKPDEYKKLGSVLHKLTSLDKIREYCESNGIKKLDYLTEGELKQSAQAFMESLENN